MTDDSNRWAEWDRQLRAKIVARGWVLTSPSIQDPEDPFLLTCPDKNCGQRWHVLPEADNSIPDDRLVCPHGCNRRLIQQEKGPDHAQQ